MYYWDSTVSNFKIFITGKLLVFIEIKKMLYVLQRSFYNSIKRNNVGFCKIVNIPEHTCEPKHHISFRSESEPAVDPITIDKREHITLIGLNRPHTRNAVNRDMALQLNVAFQAFEQDSQSNVAVLHGKGDHFCSGYDLKELARLGEEWYLNDESLTHITTFGAMGPTRTNLQKPVIAAINGFAVAGGLELALLCDLRIVEKSAKFGVLNRRFGVPLIDGGTVRLPALIGLSNALDLILTGRLIDADEALRMNLANRVVNDGHALNTALSLAKQVSEFPQTCLRGDRASAYYSVYNAKSKQDALNFELENSISNLAKESVTGAKKFESGEGRGGSHL